MNEAELEQLLEAALRRPLTDEEQQRRAAHFAATSGAREAWTQEWRVRRTVRRLPAVPVATNFTGRVLERIDAETRAAERSRGGGWRARWLAAGWLKPALAAALVVAVCGVTFLQVRRQQRATLARGAAAVSLVARIPDLKMMKDFEPIQRLRAVPSRWVDEELLAALEPGFAR